MVLDLFNDPFFKSFFYETTRETKPPMEVTPIYEGVKQDNSSCRKLGSLIGWKIAYALAGFKEEDLKVWSKKRELFVEGDNTKNEKLNYMNVTKTPIYTMRNPDPVDFARAEYRYPSKFSCSFKQKFTVSDKLDLDKMTVDFEDGLLMINIPVREETDSDKVFHFGGPKETPTISTGDRPLYMSSPDIKEGTLKVDPDGRVHT